MPYTEDDEPRDKLLHAMRASELEQIQRAIDVCSDVKPRLFQMKAARRPRRRCTMNQKSFR